MINQKGMFHILDTDFLFLMDSSYVKWVIWKFLVKLIFIYIAWKGGIQWDGGAH